MNEEKFSLFFRKAFKDRNHDWLTDTIVEMPHCAALLHPPRLSNRPVILSATKGSPGCHQTANLAIVHIWNTARLVVSECILYFTTFYILNFESSLCDPLCLLFSFAKASEYTACSLCKFFLNLNLNLSLFPPC